MRIYILLASTTVLAACGGAGTQSAGSTAISPPAPATGGTPTPTPAASFVNPADAKTYQGVGAAQHFAYTTREDRSGQSGQLYAGDANSVRNSGITVAYDPRDAIFNVTIERPLAGVSSGSLRFQDPVHRTAFGGVREPQVGVPLPAQLAGIQYLESGSGSGDSTASPGHYPQGEDKYASQTNTIFYQKPGTTTSYVTLGGYVRNNLSVAKQTETSVSSTGVDVTNEYLLNSYSLDRAVYAYGERTDIGSVPKSGSGTYTGDMAASMVYNVLLDTVASAPTYFQWITGTASTTVDFGTLGVTTALTGKVQAPSLDAYTSGAFAVPTDSVFTANATAKIDLVGTGGFTGEFQNAKMKAPDGSELVVSIAGSSLDGAFFGPNGREIGAGFRIVGGKPDERIDIIGAFTGKQ